jgi:hypothetical protein
MGGEEQMIPEQFLQLLEDKKYAARDTLQWAINQKYNQGTRKFKKQLISDAERDIVFYEEIALMVDKLQSYERADEEYAKYLLDKSKITLTAEDIEDDFCRLHIFNIPAASQEICGKEMLVEGRRVMFTNEKEDNNG